MNLSDKGAMELIGHEAIVLTPYYDSVGVLTWGVGHTAMAGEPLPSLLWGKPGEISEAIRVFRKDVERYAAQVRLAFKVPLTQEQFDAAVSFHFNTGAISRAGWVKKFNAGDVAGARKAFMDWRKPAEIIPRRTKERDLFFNGVYANGGKATVYPANSAGHVQWSKGRVVDLREHLSPAPVVSQPEPSKPVVSHETTSVEAKPNPGGWIVLIVLAVGSAVAAGWEWLVGLFS